LDNALLLQALNASQPAIDGMSIFDATAWETYSDVVHELAKVGLITQQDVDRLLLH